MSWFAAGRLARQLRAVTGSAQRIRQGDILTVMPQPRDDGEMGKMCGALGEMVDDFRARKRE